MKQIFVSILAVALVGLQPVARAGPTNLVLRGHWPAFPGENAARVQVVGHMAYVVGEAGGLQVIDVRQPAQPNHRGTYNTGPRTGLHVVGTRAYLANGTNCLEILDVSDPSNPTRVGGFKPPGYYRHAESIHVVGNLAYVVDGRLQILDISDPAQVVQLCDLDNVGHAPDIEVVGGFAYLAGEHFVSIFNVSHPRNPVFTGMYPTMFSQALSIVGHTAFVAEQLTGLRVLDVSDPASPALVATYPIAGATFGVAVADPYAYVAHGDSGITVLDVRDRAQPVRVAGCDTAGYALDACVVGDFVFVADGANGLVVLEAEPAGEPPRLTITCTQTNACLRWPSGALAFALEANADMNTPNWQPVSAVPEVEGGEFLLSRPLEGAQFFRLRRP
jgi:hypothetical protein